MIRLIIEKELREVVGSAKFAVSFGVCAILILLTFYVGAKNHQVFVARYEAAKAENLRKMEGLTDWIRVNNHRVFLPPRPLEALVNGVSNDIGRTVEMAGRGELAAVDSRFGSDPIYAVFRFLDLEFLFQIVLSLFAILFGYNAINGEKERGTLRLSMANSVPRGKYILGKWLGSFCAITTPLLIPILIGCLLLPVMGIGLTGNEWIRLIMILLAGFMFFSVFLSFSVCASTLTQRSSTSFLICLVFWIFSVFIIPRASVLLAGRAVDVPAVDELSYQKSRYRAQLWSEDVEKMSSYKPAKDEDPQIAVGKFNTFMQNLADDRNQKIQDLANRLNEQRRTKQRQQEMVAFNIARLSPSAVFSLAASRLADTSLGIKQHFIDEAHGYQQTYAEFMKEKTGLNLGGDVVLMRMRQGEQEEEKPIDPHELPPFEYRPIPFMQTLSQAIPDMGILTLFNVIFFIGAFVGFLRYDVR